MSPIELPARFRALACQRSISLAFTCHLIILLVAISALASGTRSALAQTSATILIASPGDGDVLQGAVPVRGAVSSATFLSAELAFAYAHDPTNTWYTIMEIYAPVEDAELGVWDTNLISDGEYVLRLRVSEANGTIEEVVVHVQIRNYTDASMPPSEISPTSPPLVQVDKPVFVQASPTVTRVDPETPTPLPVNAASVTATEVLTGFSRGALAVVAACLLVGVLLLRRRS